MGWMGHIIALLAMAFALSSCKNQRMGTANGGGYAGPNPLMQSQIITRLASVPEKLIYTLNKLQDEALQDSLLPVRGSCNSKDVLCDLSQEIGYDTLSNEYDFIISRSEAFLNFVNNRGFNFFYSSHPDLELYFIPDDSIPAAIVTENGSIASEQIIVFETDAMAQFGTMEICKSATSALLHLFLGDVSLHNAAAIHLSNMASITCELYSHLSLLPEGPTQGSPEEEDVTPPEQTPQEPPEMTPKPTEQDPAPPKPQLKRIYRFHNGLDHFYTMNETEAIDAGYTKYGVEFVVSLNQVPGTHEIFRCFFPPHDHFVSTDPNCEGQVFEGSLGFVKSAGPYRIRRAYHPKAVNHFCTVSEREIEYAESLGYQAEGYLGSSMVDPASTF